MIISSSGSITSPPARLSIIAFLLYFLLTRTLWTWTRPEAQHEIRAEIQAANLSNSSNSNSSNNNNNSSNSSAVLGGRKSQGDRDHNRQRQGGGGWRRRKIALRKKNFGRLEEWSSDREAKKVLLWTGYGPLQEGMQLWGRVFSDIGRTSSIVPRLTL